MPKRITIIGSGNVATHMAKALYAKGCVIVEIAGRTLAHAQTLAQTVNAHAASDVQKLLPADIYIIAVTDAAIPEVAKKLNAGDVPVAHTSGSTDITVLNKFTHHGVLYPLQTFSRERPLDWDTVPLFIA
ncbi:MAG: NAD(P)-binding domain-containing protein, partial [Prevotellaceae bacterium]|nr:NAD(P)-binding domain-containing protein [Prevotellaceae bacterium]